MEDLREQYKEKFGKYPSSQMKEETLLKKLDIKRKEQLKENINNIIDKQEVFKEALDIVAEVMPTVQLKEPKQNITTLSNIVTRSAETKVDTTTVRMTTRRRAWLKRQEQLNK